ncbi:hypothetical protein V6N13_038082 [Hibiscus sabdariffa]|uniref:Cytochrome P450 n=1 Tax=Hibiscus sabdariffa TaxID=183260 RepID=A0ABR2S3L9_9ROSI
MWKLLHGRIPTRFELSKRGVMKLSTLNCPFCDKHIETTIGDTYTFDELRDMHYLHAAISESLRLYPPVPIDTKACLNDDILPDCTFIRKGWIFTYHAYAMGRMEAIWGENCDKFLPERWLDEDGNCKQENPFKFPIFHGGPRMCLG